MSKDIGGPAFPVSAPNYTRFGMTLRDYFASKALPALITEASSGESYNRFVLARALAAEAYELADAMLTERAK